MALFRNMSETLSSDFIGPQSPTSRMAELLAALREGEYSDTAQLKEYMDIYDMMGHAHRARPDGEVRSDELLEVLDTSESEFDYIVLRYDLATGAAEPPVQVDTH